MSRSTFLTTSSSFDASETPSLSTTNTNTDHTRALRFHHRLMPTVSSSNRSNETLPIVVVQSSSSSSTTTTDTTTMNSTQHKSVVRLNPKIKRNLRGTRRSTGIRPDDVSLASAPNDGSFNEDDKEEDNVPTCNQFITITNTEPSESFDHNRTSPPKLVFKVSRVQPTFDEKPRNSFEKLSVTRADPFIMTSSSSSNVFSNSSARIFRPEEFILRRQASDDDSSSIKRRQFEERINKLESLVYDKDSIIYDLQRKLDRVARDLVDAEQQIFILQRDKLTLIKTLTSLQEAKPSSAGNDLSTSLIRTGFVTRKN